MLLCKTLKNLSSQGIINNFIDDNIIIIANRNGIPVLLLCLDTQNTELINIILSVLINITQNCIIY